MIWPAHYCDAAQGFVSWDCGVKFGNRPLFLLEEWVAGDHLSFCAQPELLRTGETADR